MDAVALQGVILGFLFEGIPEPIGGGATYATGQRHVHRYLMDMAIEQHNKTVLREQDLRAAMNFRLKAAVMKAQHDFEVSRMQQLAQVSVLLSEL